MPDQPAPRPARRAQLRTGATTLRGGPTAPPGKSLEGRILLARRKLGATDWYGEVNLWRESLLEVRLYAFTRASGLYTLVLPDVVLPELAAFTRSAVDAMARTEHREVSEGLVELVPPRRFPSGQLLIAHGVAAPGCRPIGLSIAVYELEDDGATRSPPLPA